MPEISMAAEMAFTTEPAATDEQFEEFLDEFINQLELIDREVNLLASLHDRTAEVVCTVEARDFETAAAALLVDIRTALHAAGCCTPEWPRFIVRDQVVRSLQDA